MSDIKVSIIVPVYNGSKYIDACMDCLLKQTYTNIEIILVDDGSKDDSPAKCDRYTEQDTRIRVIHKENGGLSSARNAGIDKATGEYVLFVDVDDAVTESIVEDNIKLAMQNQADVVLFSFWFNVIGEDRKFVNQYKGTFAGSRADFFRDKLIECVDPGMFSAPWNKMIRRELLITNNIRFDSSYRIYEDIVFAPKIMGAADKVIINDRPYYIYNIQSSGTLLSSWHSDTFAALKEFVKQYTNYCLKFDTYTEQMAKLEELFITHVFTYIKQTSCEAKIGKSEKEKVVFEICDDSDVQRVLGKMSYSGKKKLMSLLIKLKNVKMIIFLYSHGGKRK